VRDHRFKAARGDNVVQGPQKTAEAHDGETERREKKREVTGRCGDAREPQVAAPYSTRSHSLTLSLSIVSGTKHSGFFPRSSPVRIAALLSAPALTQSGAELIPRTPTRSFTRYGLITRYLP